MLENLLISHGICYVGHVESKLPLPGATLRQEGHFYVQSRRPLDWSKCIMGLLVLMFCCVLRPNDGSQIIRLLWTNPISP